MKAYLQRQFPTGRLKINLCVGLILVAALVSNLIAHQWSIAGADVLLLAGLYVLHRNEHIRFTLLAQMAEVEDQRATLATVLARLEHTLDSLQQDNPHA